jgi:hypothetical protein
MRGVRSPMNSRLGGPPSSESRPKETNLGRERFEVSRRGGLRGECGGSDGEASAAAVSLAREDDMVDGGVESVECSGREGWEERTR